MADAMEESEAAAAPASEEEKQEGEEGGEGGGEDGKKEGGGGEEEEEEYELPPSPKAPAKYSFEVLGVLEFFKRKGWSYNRTSNKTITCAVGGMNCVLDILMILDKKALRIIVRNIAPSRNVERVREVCEGLNDINSTMILGCFSRDMDDGDITYRVSMPLVNTLLTYEQIDHCMHIAVATVDYHYPRILKLIWSNLTPHEIVRAKPKPPLPALPPPVLQRLADARPELIAQLTDALRELDQG